MFEILGSISHIEIIARGKEIREINRLCKTYGGKRKHWRKLKGIATIKLSNGNVRKAEVHWYEAHAVGKKEIKVKRYVA
jgi:hypothetical protein